MKTENRKCENCSNVENCLYIDVRPAQERWLCGECIKIGLRALAEEEDRKAERERIQIMQSFKPHFTHDCSQCVFLGSHEMGAEKFDLYYCDQSGRIATVIARFGNEGSEYSSGMDFGVASEKEAADWENRIKVLREAYRRAILVSLIPKPKQKFKLVRETGSRIDPDRNDHHRLVLFKDDPLIVGKDSFEKVGRWVKIEEPAFLEFGDGETAIYIEGRLVVGKKEELPYRPKI